MKKAKPVKSHFQQVRLKDVERLLAKDVARAAGDPELSAERPTRKTEPYSITLLAIRKASR